MPDKWAQYAVLNPAPAQDKWAQYAQPAQSAAPPKPATPIGGDLRPLTQKERFEMNYPVGAQGESAGENIKNFANDVGVSIWNTVAHPIDSITSAVKSVIPGTSTPNPIRSLYQGLNTRPAETTASAIGQTIGTAGLTKTLKAIPEIPGEIGGSLQTVGNKMQDAGGGMMNRTVGSLQKDFKRGADPGRAYLDAGGGPALSMDSLASKGASLKNATGAKLGSLYDTATQNGATIPASKVSAAINPPIENARSVITGPGGTGNTALLDNFADSFKPSLYPRVNVGEAPSLTPRAVFDMKKNVSANTNWSDPTQFGMKKVQQQTAGALGGVLTDTLPETAPLNSQYQGLTNFTNRAGLRAQTGSMPLTSIARKFGEGVLGGALGYVSHNPLITAASALGSMALDSIPARTTMASALYQGGKGAVAIGNKLRSLY